MISVRRDRGRSSAAPLQEVEQVEAQRKSVFVVGQDFVFVDFEGFFFFAAH
jgi:hypothetical protein